MRSATGAATNLWHDLEALGRLARTSRDAEAVAGGAHDVRPVFDSRDTAPSLRRRHFEVRAVSEPASLVGGDYFDVFALGAGTLGLVIADVSGKGVPAAILTSFARSMVRNVSACSASPGETLTRVNRMLHDADLGAMFVTIFLGWYDVKSGLLRYANAGHPRPYRLGAEGRALPLGEVTGPILGILDVPRFGDGRERLRRGERLVLYTDGVIEARAPDGEFFGEDRFASLLSSHAAEPLDLLCGEVTRRIDRFQAGRRHDDATLLALERRI